MCESVKPRFNRPHQEKSAEITGYISDEPIVSLSRTESVIHFTMNDVTNQGQQDVLT